MSKEVGSWWSLSWYMKVCRWLRCVPKSYINAVIYTIPAWKANKDDLSIKIAFILLVSLGKEKLDRFYRLVD